MVYNLHITTDEAGALLELSDSLADQLEGVVEAFNHTIHPAGGYRIYETIHLDADGFVLEGIPFHTGHKIAHALRGLSSLAVVSITLGEDISRLIEQYNKEFDFITAYWLDKLSNWALEQLMRLLKQELREEVAKDHLKITSHWGPGYCGWDLKEQEKLLPLSGADQWGITLSSSMLMRPVKSMSGVVGIGDQVIYKESGCGDCRLPNCAYRSLKW